MRKLKITVDMLEDFNACQASINLFRDTFPDGIEVTDDQQENFRLLLDHPVSIRFAYADTASVATAGQDFIWIAKALRGETPWFYCDVYGGGEFEVCGDLADAVGVSLNAQET